MAAPEYTNESLDADVLEDCTDEELSIDEGIIQNDDDLQQSLPTLTDCGGEKKKAARAGAGGNGEKKKSGTTVKDKEPHMVQRRNARERRRVQLVNDGFTRLRRKIPTEPRNKKLSKVKTLQCAINYILHLQETLEEADKIQRAAGMLDFVGPVGLGGGMTIAAPSPYDAVHHITQNPQPPPLHHHDGIGVPTMQTSSCYGDWGYYDNTQMCSGYDYQGMRGNYYY